MTKVDSEQKKLRALNKKDNEELKQDTHLIYQLTYWKLQKQTGDKNKGNRNETETDSPC